jgi:hypothetical protein
MVKSVFKSLLLPLVFVVESNLCCNKNLSLLAWRSVPLVDLIPLISIDHKYSANKQIKLMGNYFSEFAELLYFNKECGESSHASPEQPIEGCNNFLWRDYITIIFITATIAQLLVFMAWGLYTNGIVAHFLPGRGGLVAKMMYILLLLCFFLNIAYDILGSTRRYFWWYVSDAAQFIGYALLMRMSLTIQEHIHWSCTVFLVILFSNLIWEIITECEWGTVGRPFGHVATAFETKVLACAYEVAVFSYGGSNKNQLQALAILDLVLTVFIGYNEAMEHLVKHHFCEPTGQALLYMVIIGIRLLILTMHEKTYNQVYDTYNQVHDQDAIDMPSRRH